MERAREPTTTFVGRERELADVEVALAGEARLVTLLGPGGAGKTRLAKRVAARHGGLFVDLSAARSEVDLIDAVGTALEIGVVESVAAADARIVQALARPHAEGAPFVVLDNLEQFAASAASVLARWLEVAPSWRALVTSRERLAIGGEHIVKLDAMERVDAVALFAQRAREAGWRGGPNEEAVFDALCRSLDDLPLAIELAAARVPLLGPEEVLRRLDERFRILRTQRRDVALRHATLENAIAWSWDLLDPVESAMLVQLSVFVGGFLLDAAEAVIACEDDILDVFERLSARSLLRCANGRYSLHESVRAFAMARFEPEDFKALSIRHARHYVALGAAATGVGTLGSKTIALLIPEMGNLNAVAERCPDGELAVKGAFILAALFQGRGPTERRLELLDRAVGMRASPELTWSALRKRALLFISTLRFSDAAHDLREALSIAEVAGNLQQQADILVGLAVLHLEQDELPEGQRVLDRAQGLYGEDPSPELILVRGTLSTRLGNFADAEEAFETLLRHGRKLGPDGMAYVAQAHRHRATLRFNQQRIAEGESEATQAIEMFRQMGNLRMVGLQLGDLGEIHLGFGRIEQGIEELRSAVGLQREIGNLAWVGIQRVALATGLTALARYDEAREELDHVIAATHSTPAVHCTALAYAARIAQLRDQLPEAQDLAESALASSPDAEFPGVHWFATTVLASVVADLGRAEEATAQLEAIRDRRPLADATLFDALFRLAEGHVLLAQARQVAAAQDIDDVRSRVEEDVVLKRSPTHPRALPIQLDIARRLLARRLEDLRGQAPRPLVVAADAAWCVTPEGRRIDFGRRTTLRRLLLALARQREGAPDVPLSVGDLVEATWPGERIYPEAAANRLYVSISALRKAGLDELIDKRAEGYLLRVPISFQDGD